LGFGAGRHRGGDFSWIFDFGGVGSKRQKSQQRMNPFENLYNSDQRMPQKGRDLHYHLTISLEDAAKGTEKKISLKKESHVEEVSVKIPAGIRSGQKLRLNGKGYPGLGGGPDGDLYLEIGIAPHRIFTREGDDIHIDLPIRYSEAVLGTTLDVPLLNGSTRRVKVAPGTQDKTKIRLKSFGIPHFNQEGKGDEFVRISIIIPKDLKAKQLELIKKLSEEGL
jgi:curved DNA-binding protein